MPEVVLRRIQAGVEATRGTAVPATKRLYGTLQPTRVRPNRYAAEDRGSFVDKFRGNPKLIEAGFTLNGDLTFEDLPLLAKCFLGPSGDSGAITSGYTHTVVADTTTDALKTLTLEAGDESVAWQGAFGVVDTADITMALDDAVTLNLGGFVQDWVPATSGSLTTSFSGFTAAIAEHPVESVMGYQSRLYIDPAGGTPGTTQITGRSKAATIAYHNQNKRKYFGDNTALFTKLGRGRRQVSAKIKFEGDDTAQYANFYNGAEVVARLSLTGTGIVGSTGPIAKQVNLDFWGYFDDFALGNVDTNTTFEFTLQAVYDTTSAKECALTVINGIATAI